MMPLTTSMPTAQATLSALSQVGSACFHSSQEGRGSIAGVAEWRACVNLMLKSVVGMCEESMGGGGVGTSQLCMHDSVPVQFAV